MIDIPLFGKLERRLALGLLRLTTEGRPPEDDAVRLIHIALDAGIRILDTADVYCLDHKDLHYGESLVRRALAEWSGPKDEVRVLTKVGLARPKGRWVPSGRPEHLREAVDRSLLALGVDRLFVVQLHARDPGVPFEETLAALAEIRRTGKVAHLGLCNVSPLEIRQAQRHFPVAVVQDELSISARSSATDGTVQVTGEGKIPFLAYRPLAGIEKAAKLAKNRVLGPIAERHRAAPAEIAIAAVLAAGPHVIPLIGATRPESIASSLRALDIRLDANDRTALDVKYSFAPSPEALAAAVPIIVPNDLPALPKKIGKAPEVVVLMGIQGAGKSSLVAEYEKAGYDRLNRDILGGSLDDLVPKLAELLAAGKKRVVLDNTYPTRISRVGVLRTALAHGVPVRCRFLETSLADAHFNVAMRQLEKYDRLLGPDEMKALAKSDPNLPPPVALARWAASFEPPALDEGFAAVEKIPFVRRPDPRLVNQGLLLDVDGTLRKTKSGELYPRSADDVELLPGRREILRLWIDAGYPLFLVSNQSGVASGKLTAKDADAAFARTVELLDLPVAEITYCPHPSFPVGCYCRKPMPGLAALLMRRHGLARERLIMVGDMDSDAEFAKNAGIRYFDQATFFGLGGPSPDSV